MTPAAALKLVEELEEMERKATKGAYSAYNEQTHLGEEAARTRSQWVLRVGDKRIATADGRDSYSLEFIAALRNAFPALRDTLRALLKGGEGMPEFPGHGSRCAALVHGTACDCGADGDYAVALRARVLVLQAELKVADAVNNRLRLSWREDTAAENQRAEAAEATVARQAEEIGRLKRLAYNAEKCVCQMGEAGNVVSLCDGHKEYLNNALTAARSSAQSARREGMEQAVKIAEEAKDGSRYRGNQRRHEVAHEIATAISAALATSESDAHEAGKGEA